MRVVLADQSYYLIYVPDLIAPIPLHTSQRAGDIVQRLMRQNLVLLQTLGMAIKQFRDCITDMPTLIC